MHTTTFDAFQFTPYYLNSCGSTLDYVNVYLTIRKCLSLKLNFHPCLAELFWSPSRGSITSNFCSGLSFACVTYFLAQEAQGVCMHVCECVHEFGRARWEGSRRRSKRRKLTFILGRRVNFLASGLRGDRRFDFHTTNFQAQHSGCSQVGSRKTCNMREEW